MRWHHLFWLLLPAVPVAVGLHLMRAGPLAQFLSAGLAVVPLAAIMGRATEALGAQIGPRFGGLLNATFGNAAELILGLLALRHGLVEVVKASIIGSIIGNALFVLGLSLLVGGLRHRRQTFDRTQVGLQATLLALAAIGLAVPTALFQEMGERAEQHLSLGVAGVLLTTYVLNLVFAFTHGRPDEADLVGRAVAKPAAAGWRPWTAAGILTVVTVLVVVLSEFLVEAVETARDRGYLAAWGMSEAFVGVIFLAMIGNAAEHSTAVLMAYRNEMDLTLHISIGSSLQVALLVIPVLVFASLGLGPRPLDLHFTGLELLAVLASVVVVHLVAADGQTHWMEGVLLLAVYLILAEAFYHLPSRAHP
jgi:Ca2+:H+ antiporter